MSDPHRLHPIGAIHGRFQPFHVGHLRYLMLALERAKLVYIGITNPEAPKGGRYEETDPLRHRASRNPLTYRERELLIRAAITHHKPPIAHDRVRIVPFNVNDQSSGWTTVIPAEAVQFVAAHELWDEEKAHRFTACGYAVEFLPTEQNRVTATAVRDLLRAGNPMWRSLLPAGVPATLEAEGLVHKIASINDTQRDPA